jgi:hypothetical protein
LPLVVRAKGIELADTLIVLPRTQRDDMNFIKQNLDAVQTGAALNDDFDMVVDTGALGWLSVHTQNFETSSPLAQAMPGFLDYAKKNGNGVWFADAGQVATWWRQRERFSMSGRNFGPRIDLNVSVTPGASVEHIAAIVMLPYKNSVPKIVGTKVGDAGLTAERMDAYRALVRFPAMAPGNYNYRITFDAK